MEDCGINQILEYTRVLDQCNLLLLTMALYCALSYILFIFELALVLWMS